MKSLASLFPNASQDCHAANPQLSPATANKTKRRASSVVRDAKWSDLVNLGKQSGKGMNATEAEYALMLEAQKRNGEILRYEYEGITLRWADMRYTPDFVVFDDRYDVNSNKTFEYCKIKLIEVKGGHIWDRDIVRFKGARAYWPELAFECWQKKGGSWKRIM